MNADLGVDLAPAPRTRAQVSPLRHFGVQVLLIALGALALRVAYVLVIATENPGFGDGLYYHTQANLLADGHGFSEPFAWLETGRLVPTAVHPPLFSVALASSSLVGATSFLAHKLVASVIGTATVVVVGFTARRLAGARAGLLAALIAALYPNLWVVDGILLPEGLFALCVSVVVLAAYRLRDAPGPGRAAVLGAAIGAAALTRGEGIFLVVVLVLPLIVFLPDLDRRERLVLGLVSALVTLAVIAPWVVRNTVRFDEPVLLSTNSSDVIAQANCRRTYHGDLLGYWFFRCGLRGEAPPGDESVRSSYVRDQGIDYARDHVGRLPVVAAARFGRVWELYRPFHNVHLNQIEGRELGVSRAGLFAYWALLPLAAGGVVVLRRRRVTLVPVLAPVAMVTIAAVSTYGNVRFRSGAEPVLALLAALALDAVIGGRAPVRSRAAGSGSVDGSEQRRS